MSEMLKILFQNISYWMIYYGKIIFIALTYVRWSVDFKNGINFSFRIYSSKDMKQNAYLYKIEKK